MSQSATVSIKLILEDAISSGVTRIKAAFGSLKESLYSLQGAAAAVGLTLTAGAVAKYLFDTNVELQKLKAQLQTFTGSADAANDKFAELQQLAIDLPFELKDITQAYIALRGAGIDPTAAQLTAFSNVAVSAQRNIADLGDAVRAATTGEMERLKQFNVTAYIQGQNLQVTFNGVTKTIGRDAESITKYLTSLGNVEFAGASARQMKTLDGQISNLEDNLFKLSTAIGEAGFSASLGDLIGQINDMTSSVNENRDAIRFWTQLVLSVSKAIFETVFFPIRLVFNAVTSILALAGTVLTAFEGTILGVVSRVSHALGIQSDTVDSLLATVEQQNSGAWQQIVQDGRDSLNALTNLGTSYDKVWTAATAKVDTAAAATKKHTKATKDHAHATDDDATATKKYLTALQAQLDVFNAYAALGPEQKQEALVETEKLLKAALERTNIPLQQRLELQKQLLDVQAELRKAPPELEALANKAVDQALNPKSTRKVVTSPTGQRTVVNPTQADLDLQQTAKDAGANFQPPDMSQVFTFSTLMSNALGGMADDLKGANDGLLDMQTTLADLTSGVVVGFAQGMTAAFAAVISGSESAGKAFAKAMTGAIAAVAQKKGDMYMAEAIADLADAFMGNPAAFAAAAKHTAAAAMMYAIAGAVTAAGGGGAGGGGAGTTGINNETGQMQNRDQEEATLVVQGGFLDMNDPRQEQQLARALSQLSGKRVVVKGGYGRSTG